MFKINIGSVQAENKIELSQDDIDGLSLQNQKTILELIGYRNGLNLFPWGYNQLISDLRQLERK